MADSELRVDYCNAKGITIDEMYERRFEYLREHKKERKPSSGEVRNDSLKRAKDQIFDLVLNNDFDYFFTGTIDPSKLDSKDPKALIKPLQQWLKDCVKRKGLSYIMIAEYHKKGGIHFHGLLRSDSLTFTDSGTKLYRGHKRPVSDSRAERIGLDLSEGRVVYNVANWSFGFSTAIRLEGDKLNTAYYVTKYITKDCKKIFGRFFWHSRDLKKPIIEVSDIDFDDVDCPEYNGFKYIFERGDHVEKDRTDI
ncbi:MAG: hypothetical protein IJ645_07175 [Ruminococcus sp.]|nr:hypothetical protein [Ruminococcus sp.]